MTRTGGRWTLGVAALGCLMMGCASEQAIVRFSHVVAPVKPLPPGLTTLYVEPAEVGPNTDPRWSDMTATLLKNLAQESRDQFGAPIQITDRRDVRGVFDESDLRAGGLTTAPPEGAPERLLAAEGRIMSNINVKEDVAETRSSTYDIVNVTGGGGEYQSTEYAGAPRPGPGRRRAVREQQGQYAEGGITLQPREVVGYQRTLTVQMEFKLLDNADNRVWEFLSKTATGTESTGPVSPLFGSSRGVGNLTPQDAIIGNLVDQAAREFMSRFLPCRLDVTAYVTSSPQPNCVQGVRFLRGGFYEEALQQFVLALAANPNDHQAAFGAGVAAEAMGRHDQALHYYRQACMGAYHPRYLEARARLETYGSRLRRG